MPPRIELEKASRSEHAIAKFSFQLRIASMLNHLRTISNSSWEPFANTPTVLFSCWQLRTQADLTSQGSPETQSPERHDDRILQTIHTVYFSRCNLKQALVTSFGIRCLHLHFRLLPFTEIGHVVQVHTPVARCPVSNGVVSIWIRGYTEHIFYRSKVYNLD